MIVVPRACQDAPNDAEGAPGALAARSIGGFWEGLRGLPDDTRRFPRSSFVRAPSGPRETYVGLAPPPKLLLGDLFCPGVFGRHVQAHIVLYSRGVE